MSKYCQDNLNRSQDEKDNQNYHKRRPDRKTAPIPKDVLFQRYDHGEIAQEFGVTKGTVSRTIKKAIENIKKSDRVVKAIRP